MTNNIAGRGGFHEIYASEGVDSFYSTCLKGEKQYNNPHRKKFLPILERIFRYMKLDSRPLLDLACGTGEISLLVKEVLPHQSIIGVDPYLFAQYAEITKFPSLSYSFEDIINGKDHDLKDMQFSMIICSYGMHLCSQVLELCQKLSRRSPFLCILTPHGLPVVTEEMGWVAHWSFKFKGVKVNVYSSSHTGSKS